MNTEEYVNPNLQKKFNKMVHKFYFDDEFKIHVSSYPIIYMNKSYVYFKRNESDELGVCKFKQDSTMPRIIYDVDLCLDRIMGTLARCADYNRKSDLVYYTTDDIDENVINKIDNINKNIRGYAAILKLKLVENRISYTSGSMTKYLKEKKELEKEIEKLKEETGANDFFNAMYNRYK